jgi:hypothetical protein
MDDDKALRDEADRENPRKTLLTDELQPPRMPRRRFEITLDAIHGIRPGASQFERGKAYDAETSSHMRIERSSSSRTRYLTDKYLSIGTFIGK